jgi:hypothetical protein
MADDELIDDSERDRFAGTSASINDRDADGVDDRREASTDRNDSDDDRGEGARAAGSLDDYDRGRRDEAVEQDRPARFNRDEVAEDDRRDTPTRY